MSVTITTDASHEQLTIYLHLTIHLFFALIIVIIWTIVFTDSGYKIYRYLYYIPKSCTREYGEGRLLYKALGKRGGLRERCHTFGYLL